MHIVTAPILQWMQRSFLANVVLSRASKLRRKLHFPTRSRRHCSEIDCNDEGTIVQPSDYSSIEEVEKHAR